MCKTHEMAHVTEDLILKKYIYIYFDTMQYSKFIDSF